MKHAVFFFGLPSVIMVITHFTLINENFETYNLITTPILFAGLIILGFGYFNTSIKKHFLLFLGWIIFAIYWATQPEFLYGG